MHKRYLVDTVTPNTHNVLDRLTSELYVLLVQPCVKSWVTHQVTVAHVEARGQSGGRYAVFTKEVINFYLWVANDDQSRAVALGVLYNLEGSGDDLGNPSNTAMIYGAELNGDIGYWMPEPWRSH